MSGIPPEQLFTIRQVARSLRVGEKQVRQWIRAGELPVVNLGDSERSKHRISNEALKKFIELRTVVHQPAAPRAKPRSTGRQWF